MFISLQLIAPCVPVHIVQEWKTDLYWAAFRFLIRVQPLH